MRTRRGTCSYSAWRTISGYSSSSNSGCSFGGGYFKISSSNSNTLDFENFFEVNKSFEKVNIDIYSIAGQRLSSGEIEKGNPQLQLNDEGINGVVIIHLYDRETGVSKSIKHIIVK